MKIVPGKKKKKKNCSQQGYTGLEIKGLKLVESQTISRIRAPRGILGAHNCSAVISIIQEQGNIYALSSSAPVVLLFSFFLRPTH